MTSAIDDGGDGHNIDGHAELEDHPHLLQVSPAAKAAVRRRQQIDVFDHWVLNTLPDMREQPSIQGSQSYARGNFQMLDQVQSTHAIIKKEETKSIIHSPRDYQLELFERAKKENLIAVLDTGMGKTLIAVLLLRWTVDQELERRAAGLPRKVSFFLATSVSLVMQQYEVLIRNLIHPVRLLYGDLNVDSWTKSEWQDILSDNKIVICTPEVLSKALARAYLSIEDVNLLIFDEAHHAKKGHPYARIIRDFYLSEKDPAMRPRIFGMTASPIDAKTDVMHAATTLEVLLDSRIITTGELSTLQSSTKPTEQILRYRPHTKPYESPFYDCLQVKFDYLPEIRKELERARKIAVHLGDWCADESLRGLAGLQKRRKIERTIKYGYRKREVGATRTFDEMREEYNKVFNYLDDPNVLTGDTLTRGSMSPKLAQLAGTLKSTFSQNSDHRCLVFVEEKITAYLLARAFTTLALPNLRCGYLVGAGDAFSDTAQATVREQAMTLHKFRKGDLNCLFATSVAEEGLDVPECNVVIRFDMYKTMIHYIQSRGRARQSDSLFIHMIEDDNSIHSQMTIAVRDQERKMRQFCHSLPADRRLLAEDEAMINIGQREERSFIDPESGAKLTEHNALVFLADFASAIPTDIDEKPRATYFSIFTGGQFKAEVILPRGAPISSIVSQPCAKKEMAKRWAAFDACLELRKSKHLDAHFKPAYTKSVRVKHAHILADGLDEREKYAMCTKPLVWKSSERLSSGQLWMTIFDFTNGLERPHTPIVLLTRTKMLDLPTIPLFRNDGESTQVISKTEKRPLHVSAEELHKLCMFTLRIFRDIFSKTYDNKPEELSYFLAPADTLSHDDVLPSTHKIDWEVLNTAIIEDVQKWKPGDPVEPVLNKLVLDPLDGARKFTTTSINKLLCPHDPPPSNSAHYKPGRSILESSYSLRRTVPEAAVFSDDQPVLNAELLNLRRNLLIPPTQQEMAVRRNAYICLEPMEISTLPMSFVISCLAWPAIIWRLESVLITQEACDMLKLECDTKLGLAAFTKDSNEVVDHDDTELLNFRQGMGENYERLEFLGDTFLKMATTISTFIQKPDELEETLHNKRMYMLCNRNLCNVSISLELFKYIRTTVFSRRLWYPEGLNLVKGKGAGTKVDSASTFEKQTHVLSMKTIADVSEALIGATYLTQNNQIKWSPEVWTMPIRAISKLVDSDDHKMLHWDEYQAAYSTPEYHLRAPTASERDMVEHAQRMHDYRFKSPTLLRSAFLHPSQPRELEHLPSYQALEFLGDALLDMAIIDHIFYRFPTRDPQWLTEHKTVMVGNRFLGALACNLGFHKLLRHSSAGLQVQITSYSTELEQAKEKAGSARDYWLHVSEPPKCLADIVESYIGAMFLDSGFDFAQVLRFFNEHVTWYFEDMTMYADYSRSSPVTALGHILQEKYHCHGLKQLTKELSFAEGVDRRELVVGVMFHSHVVAHSTGTSSKYASVRAAKMALHILDDLTVEQFREKYMCDCSTMTANK